MVVTTGSRGALGIEGSGARDAQPPQCPGHPRKSDQPPFEPCQEGKTLHSLSGEKQLSSVLLTLDPE